MSAAVRDEHAAEVFRVLAEQHVSFSARPWFDRGGYMWTVVVEKCENVSELAAALPYRKLNDYAEDVALLVRCQRWTSGLG